MLTARRIVAVVLPMLWLAACGDDDAGGGGGGGRFAGADERRWSWVDVEGSTCMDGSPTGIGVNLSADSDRLAIVFEGGGACFNEVSCTGVAHPDGYGVVDLAAFADSIGRTGLFDRDDADNPLADWNWIYVPYCTGDIHAGDKPDGFGGRRQVGYVNSTHAIDRVRDEFAGHVSQVLIAGQSAGGFGAALNYDQATRAFDGVRVDLLDDSGPPLSSTYLTPCFEAKVTEAWNLDTIRPADCAACEDGGIGQIVRYYGETYTEGHQGYVSSVEDLTIRQFIGFGYPDCEDYVFPMAADVYQAAIAELRDDVVAALPNASVFSLAGDEHVWTLGQALSGIESGGTNLAAWIGALVGDGDAPASVAP
jgi:hypothetical protein